jgi:hypothetical protein
MINEGIVGALQKEDGYFEKILKGKSPDTAAMNLLDQKHSTGLL